jgi:hypothetical protein
VVATWKGAGAELGWMCTHITGEIALVGDKETQAEDLPAFCFGKWKEGSVAKLPDPGTAFASCTSRPTRFSRSLTS